MTRSTGVTQYLSRPNGEIAFEVSVPAHSSSQYRVWVMYGGAIDFSPHNWWTRGTASHPSTCAVTVRVRVVSPSSTTWQRRPTPSR